MRVTMQIAVFAIGGALACAPLPAQMMGHSPAAQAVNNPNQNGMMNDASNDAAFVKKAAAGGIAEVELGKLAVSKSSNPDVKAFGQKMVDDHTKLNDQVKQLAGEMNIELPTQPNREDRATMAKLQALNGTAFDKAYMADMVKDHKKDLAEFKQEVASTQNSKVRDLAQHGRDVITDHLKLAESTKAKVDKM